MPSYTGGYNFAVEQYNGQWVMVAITKDTQPANTPEQQWAAHYWAMRNRERYAKLLRNEHGNS